MRLRFIPACAVLLAVSASGLSASDSRADKEPDPKAARVEWNVAYSTVGEKRLLLDVYRPEGEGPFPAVLVVHGGGWATGSKSQLAAYARALTRNGYVAFAINYRLAPAHKFPAQIEDCRSAVKWIRAHAKEYDIDPNRLGGIGYSAGGHLVALLGATGKPGEDGRPETDTRLQAVCAGGAPCDFCSLPEDAKGLAFWLGGTRAAVPEQYEAASPTAFVTRDAPPMFFFHGSDDLLVPIESAKSLADALEAAGVESEFYTIPGGGHLTGMIDPEALKRAIVFLDAHLKPGGEGAADGKTGARESRE